MNNALLVFAKRPTPGRVKTRLVPPLSPENAAELYARMQLDIFAKVGHLAGVDSFVCYDPADGAAEYFATNVRTARLFPQAGANLGERMANAFSQVFQRGYQSVAIIGTDSPDLPAAFIEEAYARLARPAVDAVFGPSEDGGYYLLAMKRLLPELFAAIPWSTDAVLARSLARAAAAGIAVELLPAWYDVDEAADLHRPGLVAPGNGAPLTRKFLLAYLTTVTS
ncbi:TIGR04282 family arsenosugar biosynthesis glycosyltransferase [Geotalea uraniireducens]|nr:TIGR04282 family arsenosugar biosynthesis glycosyltransferase [Geotalea uraniireducens]